LRDGSRYKYRSTSRVLIVGSGADEQCADYVRHRTKYRLGGYVYSSFYLGKKSSIAPKVHHFWKLSMLQNIISLFICRMHRNRKIPINCFEFL
jgi:hypothetical protein